MSMSLSSLSPRARSWNVAMAAHPGDLDVRVPADRIEGVIPASLRGGRVLSNGPGWTRIGGRTAHPFDGHGYVRAYTFSADGSCALRARFVRTAVYADEARAQRLVHRGLATNVGPRFWQNLRRGIPRNVANTTVVRWGNRLLAGWEGGAPYALEPSTLETRGLDTFGGLLEGQATLAHMHHDAARDRLLLCSVEMGRHTRVSFREVDRADRLLQTRTATIEEMTFAHDFAFTDGWYVLGGNPLRLRFGELLKTSLGASTMLRAVAPALDRPGELLLVPRAADGALRRVRLPEPAFVVHFVNAFEEDDGRVVVDACVFHRFDFGEEFGYTGPDTPFDPSLPEARGPQRLYRISIPAGATEASWSLLAPHGVDFPRVDPDREGQRAPRMVGACRADPRYSDPFDSVVAIDLLDPEAPPRLWTAPEVVFVGEPLLAPGAAGEPDHVIAILSNGLEERTELAVFRLDALEHGPVARVPLPLMPVAFHGDWDPGATILCGGPS